MDAREKNQVRVIETILEFYPQGRAEMEKSEKHWGPQRNGGGRVVWGGWSGPKLFGCLGGLNVVLTIPFAHILVLELCNTTSCRVQKSCFTIDTKVGFDPR